MLLGFKAQFAEYVASGSKQHTIRAPRKIRPKVGEICHCYTGLRQRGPIIQKLPSGEVVRQKMSRLLGRFKCVRVEEITISRYFNENIPLCVSIAGELLTADEAEGLFWRDGFRSGPQGRGYPSTLQAASFWSDRLKEHSFHGDLIHWEYKKP